MKNENKKWDEWDEACKEKRAAEQAKRDKLMVEETIRQVLSLLPVEMVKHNATEWEDGYNCCLEQMTESITKLLK